MSALLDSLAQLGVGTVAVGAATLVAVTVRDAHRSGMRRVRAADRKARP